MSIKKILIDSFICNKYLKISIQRLFLSYKYFCIYLVKKIKARFISSPLYYLDICLSFLFVSYCGNKSLPTITFLISFREDISNNILLKYLT